MPCYNVAEFIDRSLQSVLSQSYKNLEILLIDDGSTDDTPLLLNKYAENDARIRVVVNEKNLGLIRTLNLGIELSTGEYVARMDADDISAYNRLETLFNVLNADPELDAVSASAEYIDMEDRSRGLLIAKGTSPGSLKFISFFSTPVIHPCIMLRRQVLIDNKYDPEYIHSEDYELFSRLIYTGYRICNLKDVLYKLRINPGSVSRKFENIQIATHTRISERNIEKYFESTPEYYLHKVIINRIEFKVTPELIRAAFGHLQEYRQVFVEREVLTALELEEIDKFILEQRIDIILQSLKYTKFPAKVLIIARLISNIRDFTSSVGRQYIRNKLHLKF
jgi:glycosyltransferase involved in cell wall biosynthesis